MLEIIVPETELFDNKTSTFINVKEQKLKLEHSLVSISKWEMKWHKSYFIDDSKPIDEFRDYVRCMTLTQNVDPQTYLGLTKDNIIEIQNYINDPMTATTISEGPNKNNSHSFVTSELVYYWMFTYSIPYECSKWHFNRLMTLIKVFNAKNSQDEPVKRSEQEIMEENRRRNAEMKAKYNSKG